MPAGKLEVLVDWEALDSGSPEERACFATIGITCNDIWLTEGKDGFVNRIRPAPYLSGFHMAEWLAWNWWRLRWEPRATVPSTDWAFAHRMATIGHGYVWPNITIFSDGERTALISKPTQDRKNNAFRYINDAAIVVPSTFFENAFDGFFEQIRGQLKAEGISDNNFERIWVELTEEKASPEISKRRKLEALLGLDPDEADLNLLEKLVADAEVLGADAANELAADARGGSVMTSENIVAIAAASGFDTSPADAVRLQNRTGIPRRQDVAAWRRGAASARALRHQLGVGGKPIQNVKLAELAAAQPRILSKDLPAASSSFAFNESLTQGRVVLRSRWETGRRFELARIIGDRIMADGAGRLYPATASYTYRQKAQRSFAAELLSPFEEVDEMLNGDYSAEAQQDVAHHFEVSDWTIRTLLMNNRRIEREDFEESRLGEEF